MKSRVVAHAWYFDEPVPYPSASRLQDKLVAQRIAGAIPDTVLFLEHFPVITFGRRGAAANLIMSPAELAAIGTEVIHSSRGGDVTYHAPGQLVVYPIIKLDKNEADVHGYVRNLEETAVLVAADFGIHAFRRKNMTGAWTQNGKLAAIGVRLTRWVTSHGMSFNVNIDLAGFRAIVPCGLLGEAVTSLKDMSEASCPSLRDVRESLAKHFEEVFCRKLVVQNQAIGDC